MPRRADAPTTRSDGFTLLEVLVALVILSGTLLLCYRVGSSALAAMGDGEERYRATILGESTVRNALSPFPSTGRTEGTYPSPDDAFRYSLEVKEAAHKDVREVHAVVTWEGASGEMSVDVAGVAVR